MTSQNRHLHREILQVLRRANVPHDPLLPAQIKTVTATNRLQTDTSAFVGMRILPGRMNVLIRPKTFVVETTRLERQAFITTYSVVVMDAAGDLRLVEDLTIDHTDLDRLGHFIEQVADLVEAQAAYNQYPSSDRFKMMDATIVFGRQVARLPAARWAEWIILILEGLQSHADDEDYDKMLTELTLAIEVHQLEGTW